MNITMPVDRPTHGCLATDERPPLRMGPYLTWSWFSAPTDAWRNIRVRMQESVRLRSQNFTLYKGPPQGKMLTEVCIKGLGGPEGMHFHLKHANSIMITQRDYVEGCLHWYREADLQPGNPEDGEWQECHYPEPKCLGGSHKILLLKEHHAMQGVLQSEEYNHPCIYGWEKEFLRGTLLDTWRKWMRVKAKPGITARHAKGWTEESRQKVSISMMGEKNHMYGKTRPESVRRAIGEKNKNQVFPEDRKEQYRERFSGEGNPMYGRCGEQSPVYGKRWWVNSDGKAVLALDSPGEGWKLGRKWG